MRIVTLQGTLFVYKYAIRNSTANRNYRESKKNSRDSFKSLFPFSWYFLLHPITFTHDGGTIVPSRVTDPY